MSDEDLTLFCMRDLEDLGAQRTIIWILNAWQKTGRRCALCVHRRQGRLAGFLHADVPCHEIGGVAGRTRGLRLAATLRGYRRILSELKPRVVIAVNQYESLVLCLLKRLGMDFHLVVSEHCHVSASQAGADRFTGAFGVYYRNFFAGEYRRYADTVLTVSEDAASDLRERHGICGRKIKVIYNPVDLDRIRTLAAADPRHPWLGQGHHTVVAASRLAAQKRLDVLLEAWAILTRNPLPLQPEPRLLLCGDGPLRGELEAQVQRAGLQERVQFLGFCENPWQYMARAALFVSTSEWEGLPCALIEAQALGVPVVASDCPSGPREILLEGRAGGLFPVADRASCAEALRRALTDRQTQEAWRRAGLGSLERFSLSRALSAYQALGHE